jgi:hypothetical protein
MKPSRIIHVLLSIGIGALTITSLNAQAPEKTSSFLSPIAFFTAHEWDAKLPDSPEGQKRKIHAQFTWSQNRQAIRISNQFVVDGKARPYVDGLYAWDPQRQAIAFWYVDADGNLTKGSVRMQAGQLVHEFEEIGADGKSSAYVARVTPHSEESWDNEILARRGSELTSVIKVRYEVADAHDR